MPSKVQSEVIDQDRRRLLAVGAGLGLRFDDMGKRVHGWSLTLRFCDALQRLYGHEDPWIAEGASMGPNRETHFAFVAADEDAVRAFHDAAVELGAESLHSPRLWPEYHAGYFGAFVRDPDGNNVEAVCHA